MKIGDVPDLQSGARIRTQMTGRGDGRPRKKEPRGVVGVSIKR